MSNRGKRTLEFNNFLNKLSEANYTLGDARKFLLEQGFHSQSSNVLLFNAPKGLIYSIRNNGEATFLPIINKLKMDDYLAKYRDFLNTEDFLSFEQTGELIAGRADLSPAELKEFIGLLPAARLPSPKKKVPNLYYKPFLQALLPRITKQSIQEKREYLFTLNKTHYISKEELSAKLETHNQYKKAQCDIVTALLPEFRENFTCVKQKFYKREHANFFINPYHDSKKFIKHDGFGLPMFEKYTNPSGLYRYNKNWFKNLVAQTLLKLGIKSFVAGESIYIQIDDLRRLEYAVEANIAMTAPTLNQIYAS